MNSRRSTAAYVVASAAYVLTCAALAVVLLATAAPAAGRNIVLFVADDLGTDLGCYGNPVIKTPHLDRLAQSSTRYENCFATTASCSASRSVILTGLHNHANGQYGHTHNYHHFSTHDWVQSLPVLLRRLGYRTARVGKYHVGPDEVYDFQRVVEAPDREPVAMAEHSREFITENPDRPFFLYIATGDPHRSGEFALELPHHPNRFGNPAGERAGEVFYDPDEVIVPPFLPDTPECRAELAQYYQSASRVDRGVGRLREVLEQCGRWDDTLVMVTSDHGVAFAGAKTTVWDPGLRVPMLVRDPRQKADGPVASDALISLLDITPTLLDFAGGFDNESGLAVGNDQQKWEWRTFTEDDTEFNDGVETGAMHWMPYTFHGRSFLSTLGRSGAAGWNAVTASHTFHEIQMYYPMRVYRDRRYKLIWNVQHESPFPFASDLWKSPTWQAEFREGPDATYGVRSVAEVERRPKFELYDMRTDPNESDNLADDPGHAGVLADYIDKMRAFQQATGDPWMIKWLYD